MSKSHNLEIIGALYVIELLSTDGITGTAHGKISTTQDI
jgi:hypothetical protein